jgi:hypothetical protein
MAEHSVVSLQIVLHGRDEGEAGKHRQTGTQNRRSEAERAEVLKTLPWWHLLILLQGIIPCLHSVMQMVGREPHPGQDWRLLSPKKLLALVQPVEGIHRAIVCWELQLVEFGTGLGATQGERRSKARVDHPQLLSS